MKFKNLSIKNFIGDLPNIINTNFKKISDFISSIYDEETKTLYAKEASIEGGLSANTITTNNLIINDEHGKKISFAEILVRLENLEQANKN